MELRENRGRVDKVINFHFEPEYYGAIIKDNFEKERIEIWQELLLPKDNDKPLHILDIGTGIGFVAISCALKGHYVTAIDFAEPMICEAKKRAKQYHLDIEFGVMNTHNLQLENEQYDLVICRYVSWGLNQPHRAYEEWARVLKPGGKLIVVDSNWLSVWLDPKIKDSVEKDIDIFKKEYGEFFIGYLNHYKRSLGYYEFVPLTKEKRPEWDVQKLNEMHFEHIEVIERLNEKVYAPSKQVLLRTIPLFMISARKPQ